MMHSRLIATFKKTLDFPESDISVIVDAFKEKTFKRGAIVLASGSKARELFFIIDGIFKIVTINQKGNNVTQFFLKENQFCTILASFNYDLPSSESIIAACDTQVLAVSRTALSRLYTQLPYLEKLIYSITQQTLLEKIKVRNEYMGEEASARYRKFIERQADIALRVSLADVASYLNITQQSLSRIRRNTN